VQLSTDHPFRNISEEEKLAQFENAAKHFMRLSGAGFLVKLKRGEFEPIKEHPVALAVAELIPSSLAADLPSSESWRALKIQSVVCK